MCSNSINSAFGFTYTAINIHCYVYIVQTDVLSHCMFMITWHCIVQNFLINSLRVNDSRLAQTVWTCISAELKKVLA